jgi:hypothetical protein
MRFDTYNAGVHLVNQLLYTGGISKVLHDGGDIILVQTPAGESVAIYLIERAIPIYEIEDILSENTRNEVHTLFVLWCDMLLPNDGQWFEPEDWMRTLVAVYGDKIYGFDTFGKEILLFPVYFEGQGTYRFVRHGTTVNFRGLNCQTRRTHIPGLDGAWRVAGFGLRGDEQADAPARPLTRVELAFAFLGLDADADREMVKQAYRGLARLYHPDLSDAPNATLLMQQLNEAYEQVLRHLGE